MQISVLQMTSSDQPADNLQAVLDAMNDTQASDILMTPEVTNCVSLSRDHQVDVLEPFAGNSFIQAVQKKAKDLGLWVLLGSIAVKTDDADGRFANRSVLIDRWGNIAAWYDKMHMFDVSLPQGETYHESKGYRPGDRAVLSPTPWCDLGLTICYDLRFPQLFRSLAQAGSKVITVPSAFALPTGQAHWHALLRARAIETGCFIVAPAQTGTHTGSGRKTFGHSLVVDPWGDILLDAGDAPGLHTLTLDLTKVDKARSRVPSLAKDVDYTVIRANDGETFH